MPSDADSSVACSAVNEASAFFSRRSTLVPLCPQMQIAPGSRLLRASHPERDSWVACSALDELHFYHLQICVDTDVIRPRDVKQSKKESVS